MAAMAEMVLMFLPKNATSVVQWLLIGFFFFMRYALLRRSLRKFACTRTVEDVRRRHRHQLIDAVKAKTSTDNPYG